jgi:hypothetical protein
VRLSKSIEFERLSVDRVDSTTFAVTVAVPATVVHSVCPQVIHCQTQSSATSEQSTAFQPHSTQSTQPIDPTEQSAFNNLTLISCDWSIRSYSHLNALTHNRKSHNHTTSTQMQPMRGGIGVGIRAGIEIERNESSILLRFAQIRSFCSPTGSRLGFFGRLSFVSGTTVWAVNGHRYVVNGI